MASSRVRVYGAITFLVGFVAIMAYLVYAAAPVVNTLVVNSTRGYNTTAENLTAYVSASDADGNNISLAYDWRMNGTSITLLNLNFDVNNSAGTNMTRDYSIYGNNGTTWNGSAANSTPTYNSTAGWNRTGAYVFDGINDQIKVPLTQTLNFTGKGALSITTWLVVRNIDNTTDTYDSAVMLEDLPNGDGIEVIRVNLVPGSSSTKWRPGFVFETTGGTSDLRGASELDEGEAYHHFAFVYNGTHTSIYIDGSLSNSTNLTGTIADTQQSNVNLLLGAGEITRARYMNGTIDDFRVYNRSLSAAQVLALYQNRSDRIVGQELSGSQNWTACVTPNDGSSDGSTTCSNGLFSFLAPRVTSLVVNSTSSLNLTSNNLTAHIVAVEANGNNVSFAYDWRLNGVSVAVVNLNFDVNNSAGSGMTKDFSTFNNHGTVSNATWAATGGWNSTGAYRFNGTHSYIDLGNDTELAVTRWTYAMWIYRNADSGTYERLLSKSNFTIYDRFLQISNVDTLQMGYVDTVGGGHFGESTATIATGRWYHVAGTFDGTYVRIYINGTLASTSSDFSSYTPRDSGLPISLGRLGLGSVWYYEFNGTMDDVRIYNRSLSAQQVRALYLNRSDTIVSDELNVTQNWTFCITPNNGANDGSTTCSAGHVINSLAPFLTSLVVNSTSGYNSTFENLTAYPTVADLDGSNFSLVYDWRLNGTSIAFINLNFDVNNSAGLNITRGYSTVGTNATAFNGALWNATGGWNGTGAYRFDGINDYLIANKSSVMNTPFTIMMRVKPTIYRAPSGCYYQGLVENTDWSFMMRDNLDCGGSGQLLLWNRTDGAWSSNLLPLNVWTHIAVTYNNSHVTIFWNGTLHTTTALKINTIGGGPYDFIIGDGTAEPFNGTIDDFRIYSRALSAAEILADYNGNPNILVSNELSAGNNWTVCVTGSDGTEYGPTSCSGTLLINSNGAPAITSLVMNSTNGLNRQTENLTAYASTSDPNSDNVSIAYDWRVNGSSIMLVNMNFDVNNSVGTNQTRDYTRWGNNGTAYNGARWNATGGWNNTGSYFFDGVDDYLRISNNSALDLVNKTNFTVTVWVKSYNLTAQTTIIAQQDANGTGRSWLYIVSNTLTSFIGGASTVVPTNMTKNMTFIALSFVENGTADNVSIYVNGVFANSSLQNGESTSGDIIIGGSKVLSNFFNGTIDDVRIYNRSLSAAQILAIYQNKSNLILSNELVLGQNWTVCATPNDGMIDGSTSCTSGLLILPPNTCTPTSTNWAVDCADNCSLANQAIALSGNLSVYGTGGKIEFSNVNITLDKFSNNASACTIAFKPPFIFARRSG